ncbi:fusolin like protein [Alphaentomopoxvirus acuprea]|uniref:Fusolin like protein n=1 Tax=Alphaentomopoxvirus acuprea TaxID=62099 RepID=W6JPK3_9POXV|nr:fusolin like protein [Anomala cuprea entomopoxvirus]BAO49429.1 fusolin like protein [Anomala cuprea entomopoxvirus]
MKRVIGLYMLINNVFCGNYISFPIPRQLKCNNIENRMCEKSYNYIYDKIYDSNGNEHIAHDVANKMFQSYDSYMKYAGPKYYSLTNIKNNIIPNNLCSANTYDKSGMDLIGDWKPNILDDSGYLEIALCSDYIDDYSYIEVYITHSNFNVEKHKIEWNILYLIYNNSVSLSANNNNYNCKNDYIYKFIIDVPYRNSQFLLYIRHQLANSNGLGTYNCIDMIFKTHEHNCCKHDCCKHDCKHDCCKHDCCKHDCKHDCCKHDCKHDCCKHDCKHDCCKHDCKHDCCKHDCCKHDCKHDCCKHDCKHDCCKHDCKHDCCKHDCKHDCCKHDCKHDCCKHDCCKHDCCKHDCCKHDCCKHDCCKHDCKHDCKHGCKHDCKHDCKHCCKHDCKHDCCKHDCCKHDCKHCCKYDCCKHDCCKYDKYWRKY